MKALRMTEVNRPLEMREVPVPDTDARIVNSVLDDLEHFGDSVRTVIASRDRSGEMHRGSP